MYQIVAHQHDDRPCHVIPRDGHPVDIMTHMATMNEQFISEQIKACDGSFLTARMATGEPGLPQAFEWRGQRHEVARIIQQWKESSGCSHGSAERYLRKHWYEIETAGGAVMKVYFERQARSKGQAKARWWLYTIVM